MGAKNYYEAINAAANAIFNESLQKLEFVGHVHDFSTVLQAWGQVLSAFPESKLLTHAAEQVEISCVTLMLGFYRQSFATLRLAVEMTFGAVYFSAHRLEFVEWKNSSRDISWGAITDEDNGVLSARFASAFFPELKDEVSDYRNKAKFLYRNLSEYVHGNYKTWSFDPPTLSFDDGLVSAFERSVREFKEVAQLTLCIRFLKDLSAEDRQSLEIHVLDDLQTISHIRQILGGPVGG